MRASHALFLSCLDVLLSALLVAPLVVAYWRGTWQLVDAYLVPLVGDLPSAWASFAFGSVLHLLFALFRPPTSSNGPPSHPKLFTLLSRIYTAVFGLACVNSWRGAWKVLDHQLGASVTADATTFAAAIAVLSATRTLRNISAPPFVVSVDSHSGYFSFPTALGTRIFAADNGHHNAESSHSYTSTSSNLGLVCWRVFKYILDCLFSVLVIGTLVVVVWRGAWYLLDNVLFPERADWSAWGSLVLGYGLVILVFSLQVPVQTLCSHLERGIWRLIVADLYLFLSFCGTVNVWRGIWNLLNVYFLPEVPLLSNWVTHLVCLIALFLFGCSNSILVRGVLQDGSESGGKCVVFPILYIRFFARRADEAQRVSDAERELRTVQETVTHPLVLANHHKQRGEITERDGTTVPLTACIRDTIVSDTA